MRFRLLAATAAVALSIAAQAAEIRDEFFWLGKINKASAVINTEEGLLDRAAAPKIAKGLQEVIEQGDRPGGQRPNIVIKFEPLLIKAAGMDATMLHVGRSSQDMHATFQSAIMRDNLIILMEQLSATMESFASFARANIRTIVPNYTNGVAAQPNSYAHYLQGFQASFARDAQRIREFYERLDFCAMGTTVLNGTSWPLNRDRMSSYLGFKAPVPNAYDAGQFKSNDEVTELASILASIALHVGTFIEDVSTQYAQPRPWILLQEGGDNTYVSSAMPQKRNPGLMIRTRTAASKLLGEAGQAFWLAHNITPGMFDAKSARDSTDRVMHAVAMLKNLDRVVKALRVNPERAMEELNLDWTASQEVADVMMREYGLPFRVGHHVASGIVSYARAHNIRPTDFPYSEVKRIYREVVSKEYPQGSPECPMSEELFRSTLDPVAIVNNRKTAGGPQPAELEKQLGEMERTIAGQKVWARQKKQHIDESLARLDADFAKLLNAGS